MDRYERSDVERNTVPHPGDVVLEYLEFHGWTQSDLARRTGITRKTVSEICNRKAPVTPNTALALERVLQRPAHLWLNLQAQFDEALARSRDVVRTAAWTDWAERFPLQAMRKLRFSVPEGNSRVNALLSFLGVTSPESWQSVWQNYEIAYRQTRKFTKSIEAISAWVRETEIVASEIETADFDEALLRYLLASLRRLTRERAADVADPIQRLCASAGVAVVWVPELPNCGISGCARWLSDKKAMIALTLRYKTDDQMWFTFFHEVGHVLLHRKKRSFVLDNAAEDLSDNLINPEMQLIEAEANNFAADTLIAPKALSDFIKKNTFTNDSIHEFAEQVEVGPGIVVGRLQHEGILAPHQGNALKQKLGWTFPQGT